MGRSELHNKIQAVLISAATLCCYFFFSPVQNVLVRPKIVAQQGRGFFLLAEIFGFSCCFVLLLHAVLYFLFWRT